MKYKERKELLDAQEAACIKQLGYNPTSFIEDWEWEAQLKRLEMSNLKESKQNESKIK